MIDNAERDRAPSGLEVFGDELVAIRREPVTCAADRPLRKVAQVMSDENVNSMTVREENGERGIVTDGDALPLLGGRWCGALLLRVTSLPT